MCEAGDTMPPFWKREKNTNKARELTILSKNFKQGSLPYNAKNVELEISDDLTDETAKIIISEICIDPTLIKGVRNAPESPESPLSKFESEVKGENGKPYRLMFAREGVLEEARARYQEEKKSIYKKAEILERAGHYIMAAMYYETLASDFGDESFYDKARELKDRERNSQVKITSVDIDINELIKQLKESGIVFDYHCSKCGANLKINGNATGQCEYCDSKIDTMNLSDLLRKAL